MRDDFQCWMLKHLSVPLALLRGGAAEMPFLQIASVVDVWPPILNTSHCVSLYYVQCKWHFQWLLVWALCQLLSGGFGHHLANGIVIGAEFLVFNSHRRLLVVVSIGHRLINLLTWSSAGLASNGQYSYRCARTVSELGESSVSMIVAPPSLRSQAQHPSQSFFHVDSASMLRSVTKLEVF